MTKDYRCLAHAARAHLQGEKVETPAPKSLAHTARLHIENEAPKRVIEPLPIKPNSLTAIASRITGRVDEADNVGERGVIASTDPEDAGPPQAEPKAKGSKKKASTPDPDDPNTLSFGVGNPVDLAPTTDMPLTTASNDKKDKKVVEAEEKTFPRGIQLGNYHRNIRSRVMKIMATNQNLVKKHGIIPAEPKEGFDPIMAAGDLISHMIMGGKKRHYYSAHRVRPSKEVSKTKPEPAVASHPMDNEPLPKVPAIHTTRKGKSGYKAADAIARYRERLRRGETTKTPLFHPDGTFRKRNWAESKE